MDANGLRPGAFGHDVDWLHAIGQKLHPVAIGIDLDSQDHIAAGFEIIARLLQHVGEHGDLVKPGRIRQLDKGKAVALGAFSFLFGGDRSGQLAHEGPVGGAGGDLGQGFHVLAFERGHIVIQGVAGEVEAHRLMFMAQPFDRQPIIAEGQARFGDVGATVTKETDLVRGLRLMDRGGIGDETVERLKHPGAVGFQLVKGPGAGQHFQGALADAFEVHPAGKVEERGEGLFRAGFGFSGGDDETHRINAHVFQRAQRVDQRLIFDGEGRGRGVDARGHHLDAHLVEFALIHRQLVGQMNIAVHHAGHEFHRVIGLEPAGLIADHGVGGGVGFVETVVGEFFQKVEHLAGFLGVDVVGDLAAFDEFGPFLGHFLGDLFPHRAAQQVSPAKGIAAHDLRDLHHLFLIDDDALGFREDMVNRRMDGFERFQPVLDLAIGRDVFHRAGAIKGHERHDIFDAGGFHAPKRVHHA